MTIAKAILYVLAAIGLAYVALAVYLSSGLARTCRVDDVRTAVSPNLERTAKIRIESCNYTGSPMVALYLFYRSDPDRQWSVELGFATSTDFDLTWKTDREIAVRLPRTFTLTQEPSSLNDVQLQLVFK